MQSFILKIRVLIASIAIGINLTACVAAVAGAGVVAGGTLVYQHKSIGNYVSDKKIAAIANNRIYGNKELYGDNHIVVGVAKGTVLLVGEAISEQYKQQAEDIVKSINGVERVYNEITIGDKISFFQQNRDSSITSKIKLAMLGAKDFDPAAVKVITENNIVYLMGVVSPKQADIAVDIAKNTAGVTKVVKVLQYITN